MQYSHEWKSHSSGLLLLFPRGSFYWASMKKLVMEAGSAKPHGNIGKKRGVQNDASVYTPVAEYLMSLVPLCEVHATECVRTMVSLCNNIDDIGVMYFPTYMSIC